MSLPTPIPSMSGPATLVAFYENEKEKKKPTNIRASAPNIGSPSFPPIVAVNEQGKRKTQQGYRLSG
jgi:hypothetical protein